MVAIVTGSGLGLDRSSAKVFAAVGQQGGQLGDATFGRYGENVYVNAATGNLMIQRTDEVLVGQGPDDVISYAYNSLGANQGYLAQHDWQISDSRAVVGLSGPANQTGTYVTRIDADGSDLRYTYDATEGAYICTDGGNGEYRLTYNSGNGIWSWSDSKNNYTEFYDSAHGGRLRGISGTFGGKDSTNNGLTYNYDPTSGLLTSVVTMNGECTEFSWTGTKLMGITVKSSVVGTFIEQRTTYTYSSGRLKTVTTDLSPTDGTLGSDSVTTTYNYDGTSDRILSITQTGGAELDFTYDPSNRIKTYTLTIDGTRAQYTQLDYYSDRTEVTDNDGNVTALYVDGKGQLTKTVYAPAISGATPETYTYTYNTHGDLTSATDQLSNVTTYHYDTNDNLDYQIDDSGNRIDYTYDSDNHLIIKTTTPDDPGLVSTVRYAYDSDGLRTFAVDNDGGVTQYVYDDHSQVLSRIDYTDQLYDLSAFDVDDPITDSALTAWTNGLQIGSHLANVSRTDYTYDSRGNLATEKRFTACSASTGVGLTTSPYTTITYTYDQAGNLLTRQTSGMSNTEVFTYDGLNRLTSAIDLNGASTTIAWDDPHNKCTVTLASGLTTVSTYDDAGELITISKTGNGLTSPDKISYQYDKLGRLRVVSDATHVKDYYLYDNIGRKVADIADDGAITEYRYDNGNRLIATIGYANKISSANLSGLTTSGNPTETVTLAGILPSSNAADVWSWRTYDGDNRVVQTIDGDGDVVNFTYDNMSNVIQTTAYAARLSSTTVSGYKTTLPTSPVSISTTAGKDDTTRSFYDAENRLVGTLDGNGYLTQIVYDGAGRKTDVIVYAEQVPSGHRADATLSLVLASITPAASADNHTRYFYDDRDLLRFTLNADLVATQYVYDAADHLTNTIAYAAPIASTSTYTLSYVQTQVATLSSQPNHVGWNVYDPASGALAFTIDPVGRVTAYTYDAMGNVIATTAYNQPDSVSTLPSLSDMTTWVGTNSSVGYRTARNVYDAESRLRYAIDAENYVTRYDLDDAGRTTAEIRYATKYTTTGNPDYATMAATSFGSATIPSTAVETTYSYNDDGRLAHVIADAGDLAVDTYTQYDNLGRVASVIEAYGTADAVTTTYTYDTANRLLTVATGGTTTISYTSYDGLGNATNVSDARGKGTVNTYDAMSRLLTTTDPNGNANTYTYDAFGNVLTFKDGNNNTTTYTYDHLGRLITKTDALGNQTVYAYDVFSNLITTTDPLGNIAYSFYDKLNRLICQIDQQRYITLTSYTARGDVASVTRLAAPLPSGTITPGVMPTSLPTDSAHDQVTTFAYDKLGRVTQTTDAEGYYEQYTLDAFGNRTDIYEKSYTASKVAGEHVVDTYDAFGRLLTETLPLDTYDDGGFSVGTSIVNTYSYDLRGNRKTMLEGGTRLTTYAYDALDRPTSSVVSKADGTGVDVVDDGNPSHVHSVTPTTTYTYDAAGNLIETDDPTGGRTLFYYDDGGRKTVEVGPTGTLTNWTYDGNDQMLSVTTYGDAVALGDPHDPPPTPVDSSKYRKTDYTYDAIGRLTFTTVHNLTTGQYGGSSYTTASGDVATENRYNKTTNALRQLDGNGASTFTYYDKLGRVVASVDQDKYVTVYTLDTNGNVVSETRYANAYGNTLGDGTTLTTLTNYFDPAHGNHGDAANDRTTTFTYDRNGQRLTESRLNVAAYDISTTSGAKSAHSGTTSTIAYTYNGLGEVLTKTQATGDSVTYTYDGGGRQRTVQQSIYTNVVDHTGTATPQVQESLSEKYDALGDLVFTNEYDNIIGSASWTKTHYTYDDIGRLVKTVDADSFETDYAYDAAGRLVVTSYARKHSDGTTTNEAQITEYDAAGRATLQGVAHKSDSTWMLETTQETVYNAYGDVYQRKTNGNLQQTYDYDGAGRVAKLTDEGVVSFYLYDKAGHQTLSMTSDGVALASGTLGGLDIGGAVTLMKNGGSTIGGVVQGIVETITVYDARGQATQTRAPNRQLSGNATDGYTTDTILTSRAYNAFGEVTQEVDARGYTTAFSYTTLGKVASQVSPQVTSVDAHGVASTINPTQNDFYDISGRLVGVQDPDGVLGSYVNTRLLVGGSGYDGSDALVAEEFHADGGKLRNIYDAQGNVVEQINEVGAYTDYVYDGMDRLTQVTHPTAADSGNLVDNYTYDNFGNRLTHWNSVITSTYKEKTDYDAEGRVAKSVDFDGYTTSYSYSWLATTASHDLVESGGWQKVTTNAAALTDTLVTDAEGRTISETDFGGHSLSYGYDLAGRVVERDNDYIPAGLYYTEGEGGKIPTSEVRTTSYYNTGLVAQELSSFRDVESAGEGLSQFVFDNLLQDYSYDDAGNRTYEDQIHAVKEGNVVTSAVFTERESATYDALGRMTHMQDDVTTGTVTRTVGALGAIAVSDGVGKPVTVDIQYDASGNIRERKSTFWLLKDDGTWDTTAGQKTEDDWYNYDVMNRFTTTKGTWVDKNSNGIADSGDDIERGTAGTDLAYDLAGERVTATTTVSGTTNIATYTYSLDGYMTEVDVKIGSGSSVKRGTSQYDELGRIVWYKEYDTDGTTVLTSRNVTGYDRDGLMTGDQTITHRSDGSTDTRTTTYTYTDTTDYGGAGFLGGLMVGSSTTETIGSTTTHTGFGYAYLWFSNGAVQDGEAYDSNTSDPYNSIGISTLTYDQREALATADIQDGAPRFVTYSSSLNGEIMTRDTAVYSGNAPHARYYYFNGIQMGDVSDDGTSNVDYVTAIARQRAVPGAGYFTNGATSGVHLGEFDQSYDTINGLTYQSTASSYTVQGGDTLQGIAQQVWGDSSFWYLIADANGLDSTSTLIAGQTLIIPDKVANTHNNTGTYNVYDPNAHMGNISPTAPFRPQTHNCGVFGQILEAIVTVVVSIYFGPVAGNVAGQLFGMATGIQKSFNWNSLGMTVIAAAVTSALGPLGIVGQLGADLGTVGNAIVNGAFTDALSQGLGVATGLQKSFNWTEVAAAGVGAGVGTFAAGELKANFPQTSVPTLKFVSGMASDIANAATVSLVNGTDFGDNIVKALPQVINTLGNYIHDLMPGSAGIGKAGAPDQFVDDSMPPPPSAAPSVLDSIVRSSFHFIGADGGMLRNARYIDSESSGGGLTMDGDWDVQPDFIKPIPGIGNPSNTGASLEDYVDADALAAGGANAIETVVVTPGSAGDDDGLLSRIWHFVDNHFIEPEISAVKNSVQHIEQTGRSVLNWMATPMLDRNGHPVRSVMFSNTGDMIMDPNTHSPMMQTVTRGDLVGAGLTIASAGVPWASLAARGAGVAAEVPIAAEPIVEAETVSSGLSQVQVNRANGLAFQGRVAEYSEANLNNFVEEVSIRPNTANGPANFRVRLDGVGTDPESQAIKLIDAKGSENAPLTVRQEEGYPLIEEFGGTIVGKNGGSFYPPGTIVPPGTSVRIIRPGDLPPGY